MIEIEVGRFNPVSGNVPVSMRSYGKCFINPMQICYFMDLQQPVDNYIKIMFMANNESWYIRKEAFETIIDWFAQRE